MNLRSLFCNLNIFCSKQTSLIIFSGIFIGFISSFFSNISNTTLSVILFLELFLACFKINFSDFKEIVFSKILILFILRYLILPILLFELGSLISIDCGLACLLLSLLPAGVSSPGFSSLFNANVALTLAIVLLSSLLAPLYIPIIIKQVANLAVEVDVLQMFTIIFLIIVLPILIHLPFRKSKKISNFFIEFNPLLLMPLVWFTIVVPISRIRPEFFSNLKFYLLATFAFMSLYALFVFLGYILGKIQKSICIKSYIITSVIHNITLGVVLALMYFPTNVAALVVTANISLLIILTLLKPTFRAFSL